MKLVYDKQKIKEGLEVGSYDEQGLARCVAHNGKHKYPSKLMFVRFLDKFKDVPGTAEIWSERDNTKGTVTIHVEVKYKPRTLTVYDTIELGKGAKLG